MHARKIIITCDNRLAKPKLFLIREDDTAACMEEQDEINAEHIVVVGAGPAGLAVALGLHRKGVRSVVLESSPALRASGYAITTWPNAFRALDALGVGDKIRKLHLHIQG